MDGENVKALSSWEERTIYKSQLPIIYCIWKYFVGLHSWCWCPSFLLLKCLGTAFHSLQCKLERGGGDPFWNTSVWHTPHHQYSTPTSPRLPHHHRSCQAACWQSWSRLTHEEWAVRWARSLRHLQNPTPAGLNAFRSWRRENWKEKKVMLFQSVLCNDQIRWLGPSVCTQLCLWSRLLAGWVSHLTEMTFGEVLRLSKN